MFGPNKENTAHGIVRFGGHALQNETAVECALREVQEEASVNANLYDSPCTYFLAEECATPVLAKPADSFGVTPFMILGNPMSASQSVMFVGNTSEVLQPSGETQGIVMLTREEIQIICKEEVTLGDFVKANGKIIERSELCRNHKLVPYLQLKFLNWVLLNTDLQIDSC